MEFVKKNIDELIPASYNPRKDLTENDAEYKKIKRSIEEFGYVDPIIYNKRNNTIIGGHQRLKVLKSLGYTDIDCVEIDIDEDKEKALNIALNKISGEWDNDKLADLLNELNDINFDLELTGFDLDELEDLLNFDIEEGTNTPNGEDKGSLQEKFIVPPFSVLDTRQGYWQDRKRMWLEITGDLSETRDGEFGKLGGASNGKDNLLDAINGGTSNFDPVLAEIMYKWFCIDGGRILDPFGGEQTKGVVAGHLGYKYNAVEIREDQVKLNNEKTAQYKNVKYYCGDSNNIDTIISDRNFDFCFTSPPYYDLEVYSKDDMSALGTYEEFMAQYENIFGKCYEMLADNTFLVVKVGEIRDKKTGQYRGFVPDNIKIMERVGFKFYNDIVLVNACGTAPFRANKMMSSRKIVKVHQNVLVFYKGDLNKIKDKFPPIEISDDDEI